MSETKEFDGFYAIYYHGNAGPGLGQVQLLNKKIIGADATGGIWDGEFAVNAIDQLLSCSVTIKLPQGVPLATTGMPIQGSEATNMKFQLPFDFSSRPYVTLELPIGKANVRFQKIR